MTRHEEKIARLEKQIARAAEQKAKAEQALEEAKKKEMQKHFSDYCKLRKALESFISDDEIKKLSEEQIVEILRQKFVGENIVSNQTPVQENAVLNQQTMQNSAQASSQNLI